MVACFLWIGADVVEVVCRLIPLVDSPVVGGVDAMHPMDQLPVTLDAPEVLQCCHGVLWCHVVNRMSHSKHRISPCRGLRICQIDPGKICWHRTACQSRQRWKQIDR